MIRINHNDNINNNNKVNNINLKNNNQENINLNNNQQLNNNHNDINNNSLYNLNNINELKNDNSLNKSQNTNNNIQNNIDINVNKNNINSNLKYNYIIVLTNNTNNSNNVKQKENNNPNKHETPPNVSNNKRYVKPKSINENKNKRTNGNSEYNMNELKYDSENEGEVKLKKDKEYSNKNKRRTKFDLDNILNLFASVSSMKYVTPKNYNDIKNKSDYNEWNIAIKNEFNNMRKNKVFIECNKIPNNATIIKPLWVFAYKYNDKGDIVKRKARLVAKGCTQQKGIDYVDNFSPTLHQDVLRIICAISAHNNFEIHRLDIKAAYLNAELKWKFI